MEGMEYNSEKEHLVIPEYGRNIQNLIREARSIEDLDQRRMYVDKVAELIMQMHPQNKNLDDYRDKMWKHVFRIADYDLPGIVPPNGEIPTPGDHKKKPDPVPYPSLGNKYKHYGNNVQLLIKKAIKMEEGAVKEGFVNVIGSYMKLAYKTWNREHYVSDELIVDDLESISKGNLTIDEDTRLDGLTQPTKNRRRNAVQKSSSRNDRDRDNRGGGRRGGRRDRHDRDNRGSRGGGGYRNKRR